MNKCDIYLMYLETRVTKTGIRCDSKELLKRPVIYYKIFCNILIIDNTHNIKWVGYTGFPLDIILFNHISI